MEFSVSALILLTFHVILFSPASSDPRNSEAGLICSESVYTPATAFVPNFVAAMRSVTDQMNRSRWGSANESAIKAFGQCHADLSPKDCAACSAAARTWLARCLPSVAAAVFLDGCALRYDNGTAWDEDGGRVKCGAAMWAGAAGDDEYMRAEFSGKVRAAVGPVEENAARNGGFGVWLDRGGVEDVYMLAQCWRPAAKEGCRRCLRDAGERLAGECAVRAGAGEGRAMFPNCFLRYSTEKFFKIDPERDNEKSARVSIIIAGILSAIALALFSSLGVYFGYKRMIRKKKQALHGDISITLHNSSLNFKYETLEKATEYFDPSRKLGQGGAGSVFKGILPDGRAIAVKRLFFNTRQWADEFFNEVNLISEIDHKNVVKLLGCSIEGAESLLVYEFVPNRSLDQILFDKKNTITILSWQQRFGIIFGTAEGLAYLHGGSGVRIIHRDIKTSNILLSENLTPKIADFGLARSVASDKTHVSTGIAGTLGYMAPEYLVRGQLTEKADVYAFGVMVLEIVCGRKNSAFTLGSSSILHNVWKLHKENKIVQSVDPGLKGNFPMRETSNVLQIGLLCTQASVPLRPCMSEVVQMLSETECEIPSPKQPPFLNASLLNSDALRIGLGGQNPAEISCPYSYTVNSTTVYESACESSIATCSLVSTKLL